MWKTLIGKIAGISSSFRLTTFILLLPLVSLLLYGVLTYLFFFYAQQRESKRELHKYERTLMENEKSRLKEKVENLVQFIHYYDSKSSDKIKRDARSIVNLVVNVTNNICTKYRRRFSEQALKTLIVDALSGIKFERDLGYLFVIDMKGNIYVHIDPKMVGTNIMDIQDVNGKYIVREFTRVLKEKGEGFVDYYWYIVSEDRRRMHYKISYVKRLQCFDWYVGAGEYLKYMKRFVRQDLLTYIRDNPTFEGGYFFITDSNNRTVYVPPSADINETDLVRYRIEGFYEDNATIAYTAYVAEYDWYVTALKALSRIRSDIALKKARIEQKREEDVKTNLYLLLFTWGISLLFSIYLSLLINKMLRRYERQLQETNDKLVFQSRQALLGELLPMIAHQWRQPINKIASVLALLRMRKHTALSDEERDAYYQNMEDNIEFMSETIDDFRTFYQPRDTHSTERLDTLVLRSAEFLESALRKKSITLRTDLLPVRYTLYANEFLQVMINLIKNAVDALEEGGAITVRMKRRKDDIVLDVEDNGKGIAPSHMQRIFDPYFTTKKDSMGLGLYMSRIIVQKHMHGRLEAENLPDGGVRFRLYLPLQE